MKKILRTLLCLVFITLISMYYYSYQESKRKFINNIASDITINNEDNGEKVKDNDVNKLEDSGIEGTSFIPNSNYYPYYELLSNNEKRLYEQIYENSINMKRTFIPHTIVNKEEASNAIMAVFNDHPEMFWLNTSYTYKYIISGTIVQITLSFNETSDDIENAKILFEEKANAIIDEASKLESDYDKEKYVHDILIQNTIYDKKASVNQSAYSSIVNGKSVCAGYARAFQYIMTRLGISTYYIMGTSNGEHAWNLVKLDNNYYNVDVTWDDNSGNNYAYFNVADSSIYETHLRKGLSIYLPESTSDYQKETKKEEKNNIIIEVNNDNITAEDAEDNIIYDEKETDA